MLYLPKLHKLQMASVLCDVADRNMADSKSMYAYDMHGAYLGMSQILCHLMPI